jgi:hypothetical protein
MASFRKRSASAFQCGSMARHAAKLRSHSVVPSAFISMIALRPARMNVLAGTLVAAVGTRI